MGDHLVQVPRAGGGCWSPTIAALSAAVHLIRLAQRKSRAGHALYEIYPNNTADFEIPQAVDALGLYPRTRLLPSPSHATAQSVKSFVP